MSMLGGRLPLELYYIVTSYLPASDLVHLSQTNQLHNQATYSPLQKRANRGILMYAIKHDSRSYLVRYLTPEMLELEFDGEGMPYSVSHVCVSHGAWDVLDLLCTAGMNLLWTRKHVELAKRWGEEVYGRERFVWGKMDDMWKVLMLYGSPEISLAARRVWYGGCSNVRLPIEILDED
ncbi:hypothetical protein K440DRAFT_665509 [Wilcoxina mikolae CBS 423.85]|nr:hypothetical protein K440DRAFT_665509 [Wilcoxina mikolae CBS 423.85]